MVISNYLQSPIRTKISVIAGQPIPFPQVEICRLSDSGEEEFAGNKTIAFENRTGSTDINQTFITCLEQEVRLPCDRLAERVEDEEFSTCFLLPNLKPQLKSGVGLVLLVDSGSSSNDSSTPSQQGLAIRIEKEYSLSSRRKLLVQARTNTRIVLKATQYTLLNTEIVKSCATDMKMQFLNVTYSDSTCREDCRLQNIFETCGCLLSVPRSALQEWAKAGPFCRLSNETQQECEVAWLAAEGSGGACESACLPNCHFWHYAASMSAARFPSAALKAKGKFGDLGIDWGEIGDRLVLLEIVFEDLTYEEVKQERSQTTDGFISQIG